MKRCGRLALTLAIVTLAGGFLFFARPGRLHRHHPAVSRRQSIVHAQVADPFATPAARRWWDGQPTHWRTLLLQR